MIPRITETTFAVCSDLLAIFGWQLALKKYRPKGLMHGLAVETLVSAGAGAAVQAIEIFHAKSPPAQALAVVALCSTLTICSLSDLLHGYIFDLVSVPSMLLVVTVAGIYKDIVPALLGAAETSGMLAILYVISRRRWIGLGDVKLAAVIGAALGFNGPLAIELGFLCGGAYAACLLLTSGRRAPRRVPFGPHLAIGAYVAALTAS